MDSAEMKLNIPQKKTRGGREIPLVSQWNEVAFSVSISTSRIPDPNFFHPGYEFFSSRIPDPGSKRLTDLGFGYASKNWSILTQNIVSKFSDFKILKLPNPELW
jgi:hypothetical protein